MRTLKFLGVADMAKFGLSFRDKDPTPGGQGFGKGDPEDKGIVIASKFTYLRIVWGGWIHSFLATTSKCTPEGSVPEARPGLGGGKVSFILPPSAIIAPSPLDLLQVSLVQARRGPQHSVKALKVPTVADRPQQQTYPQPRADPRVRETWIHTLAQII